MAQPAHTHDSPASRLAALKERVGECERLIGVEQGKLSHARERLKGSLQELRILGASGAKASDVLASAKLNRDALVRSCESALSELERAQLACRRLIDGAE